MAEQHSTPEMWSAVDAYLCDALLETDPILDSVLERSAAAGLPPIHVAPNQGALLKLLAQSVGSHRILELGTLGGYSAIWLARALPPGGRLVTVEIHEQHARVARENMALAGLSMRVDVRHESCLDVLNALEHEHAPPFDLVFIDADKQSAPEYFRRSLALSRQGSLIIVDNVVRDGDVCNPDSADARTLGVRECLAMMGREPRVQATAIQTVGSKGYDGFAIARVISLG